jgi:hypothetical protein
LKPRAPAPYVVTGAWTSSRSSVPKLTKPTDMPFFHTDVEDFAAIVREVARCLRSGGRFIYLGVHPCFVLPWDIAVVAEKNS